MMAKVRGQRPRAHPLWQWLKAQAPGLLGSRGRQVELHQVPGRPRRPGHQALCAQRRARGLRKRHRSRAGGDRESGDPRMFKHLEPYAGDPILSLNEAFQKDPRPHKVNLSIGIYFDDDGPHPGARLRARGRGADAGRRRPPSPTCRSKVRRRCAQRGAGSCCSAPATRRCASGRIATLQTIGSSGGLKVGADFIKRWLPGSEVWVSDPSWDNHRAMFEGAGLAVHTYPYYDPPPVACKFDAMLRALRALPAAQRRAAARLLPQPDRRRPDARAVGSADAGAARARVAALPRHRLPGLRRRHRRRRLRDARCWPPAGLTFFVANSFSKSMSVYGERAGALSVVCADAAEAELVLGPAEGHRAPQLLEPGDPRRRHRQPRARPTRRCAPPGRPTWRRCANASWPCGAACTPCCGQAAGPRLRLLPQPARHVQLHRPERRAGRPAARRIRRLPRALGAHVRGRPEHAATSSALRRRWRRCWRLTAIAAGRRRRRAGLSRRPPASARAASGARGRRRGAGARSSRRAPAPDPAAARGSPVPAPKPAASTKPAGSTVSRSERATTRPAVKNWLTVSTMRRRRPRPASASSAKPCGGQKS